MNDTGQIIKKFLISVFVVMCISALIVCADYAGGVTGHRIDGREIPTVSTQEIEGFFEGVIRNFCR